MPGSMVPQTASGDLQARGADALANTSVVPLGNLAFNGTTWDRIRSGLGDAAASTGLLGLVSMLFNGSTYDRLRTANVFKDVSTVAVGSIATVWTPASGKKFRLMGGCISNSAAVNVLFEDNAAGAGNFIFRTPTLLVGTPFVFVLPGNGFLSGAADRVLKATGSGAGNLVGTLFGTEE